MRDKYKVEHFSADNVAVGQHAFVKVRAPVSPAVQDAIDTLRHFVSLLPEHIEAHDGDSVRAHAQELEVALKKKRLNRDRIERILGDLMLGVSGIATVANAVDAVQAAVVRLFT
ncbi:MAG TPA: hypothetical protein VMA72_13455 [Streptosporangiaceae bacterium]|nr:hypothetical protein [Streptosporangiaceae bacterium]